VTGLAPSYQSCDIPGELQPEGKIDSGKNKGRKNRKKSNCEGR